MEGLKHIAKIREYCDYIEEHLLNVQKAWKILQEALKHENVIWDDHLFFNIDQMIKEHDVSKMSSEEFIPYQQVFFPVDEEKKGKLGSGWEHHKANNPHHWENWTKNPQRFPNEHSCHIVCMIADWMGMGMKFDDTAESYYESAKEKIDIPEWADRFVRDIFAALKAREKGKEYRR